MSAVTLETLRADYEAARFALIEAFVLCEEVRNALPSIGKPCYDAAYLSARQRLYNADLRERRAGQVLAVASLYKDEAEGLKAAVLYKLSDGQIDPRQGGDA